MSQALAYLNGQFQPAGQAVLTLHDAGFVMGATVTDLCRTVRHRLYRWDDHVARFRNSCRAAQIHAPLPDDDISRIAHELVAHNSKFIQPAADLVLVQFVTPGPIGYYAGMEGAAGDAAPTFGMHTFPLPLARYRGLFSHGAHLAVPPTRQVPVNCVDPRIKQRSRMHWWLADREVQAAFPGAAALALLLDEQGHLTETASANVLIVKSGVVHSPPRRAILGGISLLVAEELCRDLGMTFVEGPLSVHDAMAADEIIITSTPWCLCGVSQFNGVAVPWPGAVYQKLLAAWSERIGLPIREQIMTASS